MKTEDLYAPRGPAYNKGQISDSSHYPSSIDQGSNRPKGYSRRHGDASKEVQQQAIDALVHAGQTNGMQNDAIAIVLAIARHESGFNPDAAAGPTTASGLGQFINRTGARYGITDANRWDLNAQASALVKHTNDNIALAKRRGIADKELARWVYKYHHDGPSGEYGGLQIADRHVVPLVPRYLSYLEDLDRSENEKSSGDRETVEQEDGKLNRQRENANPDQNKTTTSIQENVSAEIIRGNAVPQLSSSVNRVQSAVGSGNVLINGRTAVHATSGGTLTTIDVCWTKVGKPVVRIPYTNIAKSSDAAKTAGSVLINGQPVCTKTSIFATSTGDETGDRLGVKSGTIKGKAEFITASTNVFFEGIPAERQGDLMVSNNKNTPPAPLMQPGAAPPPSLKTASVQSRSQTQTPFKIALEVAGGKSHNLKGALVATNGQVARNIPVGSTARVGGHRRELMLEDLPEGNYDLLLRFPDERYDFYQIPLGRQIPTCPKEKPGIRSWSPSSREATLASSPTGWRLPTPAATRRPAPAGYIST